MRRNGQALLLPSSADRMANFLVPSTGIASDLHSIPEFHFLQRQTNLFKEVVAFDKAGPGFNLRQPSRASQRDSHDKGLPPGAVPRGRQAAAPMANE